MAQLFSLAQILFAPIIRRFIMLIWSAWLVLDRLQQKLQLSLQRLSRSRRFYHAGGWHLHGSNSLFAEQVIGRDYSQYLCLDLSHLPAGKRADALKYQILSSSPWPNPEYQVAWYQGYAQLWLWPHLVEEQGSSKALASHAETVFWQPPSSDGLFLYGCATGFDLQYWQQGRLQASQWFASEPEFARQQWFARSQGLSLGDSLKAQTPQQLPQPWPSVRINPVQGLAKQPGGVLRWGAFAFLLIASLQLTALAQWSWQSASYQNQRQQLEQELGNVLQQRTSAREALVRYQQLEPLLESINPLHIQQLVTERLAPVAEFEVINWSRQDLTAELTIETISDSTLPMVNALRGSGIRDVQAQPGTRPNQYRLTMQLEPQLPWPASLTTSDKAGVSSKDNNES